MNKLNLLPTEIKDEINYAKKNTKLVRLLFISIGLLFAILAFFVVLIFIIKNEESIAGVEHNSAKRLVDQKNHIEKEANDLADRLTTIKKLKKERIDWSTILNKLDENTPADLQIQSIEISNSEKKRAKITGAAKTNRDVVLFKDLLSSSKIFKFVDIETITEGTETTKGNASIKNFTISFSMAKLGGATK
jgi:Tfp pilus assembly protein PilN